MAYIVSSQSLFNFVKSAFIATGFSNRNANITADLMVQADISGQDGHGIFRLPQYIKRLQVGGMNPKPKFQILKERTATALIDGDNGIGHLVMRHAADIAIEKAQKSGVAWVGATLQLAAQIICRHGVVLIYF